MAWRRFHDTVRLLKGEKWDFVATIVAGLRERDGNFHFEAVD
jgi:hypothetical protein